MAVTHHANHDLYYKYLKKHTQAHNQLWFTIKTNKQPQINCGFVSSIMCVKNKNEEIITNIYVL